jgi:hypothetical protein
MTQAQSSHKDLMITHQMDNQTLLTLDHTQSRDLMISELIKEVKVVEVASMFQEDRLTKEMINMLKNMINNGD